MRALAREAYGHYVERIGREPPPMVADFALDVDQGRAWVAQQEGRIVGLLVLEVAEDHVLLENVAVAPASQGTGIGRRLLRLAEDQAQARGLAQVRLYTHETMTENQEYYARHGYRETHRASDHGLRRVFFTKHLT